MVTGCSWIIKKLNWTAKNQSKTVSKWGSEGYGVDRRCGVVEVKGVTELLGSTGLGGVAELGGDPELR